MKKSRIKIKTVKSKLKVSELLPKNPEIEHDFNIETEEKRFENIESKAKSSSLPILKKGEVRVQEIQQPGKPREKKDEEHIFISYERFGMSAREKQRVYSQDLRSSSAPIRQTGTLERGSGTGLSAGNLNEVHSEQAGSVRIVGTSETELINEELRNYSEGPSADYKPRKRDDFY